MRGRHIQRYALGCFGGVTRGGLSGNIRAGISLSANRPPASQAMSEAAHTVFSMRILHTSDWHIGRSFHGHSTLAALRGVLETLAEQVRTHRVDVVIVAGDVFDSATPSADCYSLPVSYTHLTLPTN